jgi:hypothetical protein
MIWILRTHSIIAIEPPESGDVERTSCRVLAPSGAGQGKLLNKRILKQRRKLLLSGRSFSSEYFLQIRLNCADSHIFDSLSYQGSSKMKKFIEQGSKGGYLEKLEFLAIISELFSHFAAGCPRSEILMILSIFWPVRINASKASRVMVTVCSSCTNGFGTDLCLGALRSWRGTPVEISTEVVGIEPTVIVNPSAK